MQRAFTVIRQNSKGYSLLTINSPEKRNALSLDLLRELNRELAVSEQEPSISCSVITGTGSVFASGGNLNEMIAQDYGSILQSELLELWDRFFSYKKIIIAAVNGFALGGGFQLVQAADIVLIGKSAKVGHPEVSIGTIPGIGGTQRVSRSAGKSKAMEIILTGRLLTADEAVDFNLASRVLPDDALLAAALDVAKKIARQPINQVMMVKESFALSSEDLRPLYFI